MNIITHNKQIQILPTEIIHLILEYQGYHKNRNGKWMTRLHMDKYILLCKIPRIQPIISEGYIDIVGEIVTWGCKCNFMRTIEATETSPRKNINYVMSNYMYGNDIIWTMNARELEYGMPPKRMLKNGRIQWKHKYTIEYRYPML